MNEVNDYEYCLLIVKKIELRFPDANSSDLNLYGWLGDWNNLYNFFHLYENISDFDSSLKNEISRAKKIAYGYYRDLSIGI